ncbi:MAG: hypothetical protein A2169_06830 [Deltaproteobacteria bacterium RBG_13_47_9]|nr:MAG: hypothetical protein A2169_06830 [Deltaproteobacteria bacterium RBG_13_47_9]
MSNQFPLKNRQDFYGGLFFLGLGVFGVVFGKGYTIGTISRMGPGYLPMVLSYALIIIGTFIAIRAIRHGESHIESCYWRPIVSVLGSILVFAFLIPRGGLVLSTLLVTILSSFGTRETRWRSAIVLGILMALLTALVFIKLLGLPISVWPK